MLLVPVAEFLRRTPRDGLFTIILKKCVTPLGLNSSFSNSIYKCGTPLGFRRSAISAMTQYTFTISLKRNLCHFQAYTKLLVISFKRTKSRIIVFDLKVNRIFG